MAGRDAEVAEDAEVGVVVPDVPDVPMPVEPVVMELDEEAGCIPVVVPNDFPAAWPFGDTQQEYQSVFWDWASGPMQRCANATCHGGDETPLIPEGVNLSGQYDDGIDQLWALLRDERAEFSGRLWRHYENYDGPGGRRDPVYRPEHITFLRQLVQDVWACNAAAALAEQDAGPNCGPPEPAPDAGVPPDEDGGEDAGEVDAGDMDAAPPPPDAGMRSLCYCEVDVGPLNTMYCSE